MSTSKEEVCRLINAGLSRLVKETDVLWPGSDAQLPERNLSLYVAHELLNSGYTAMTEWPFNRNEHIDLVAFEPQERTLLLVESKRSWHRALEIGWLCDDVERCERAARCLDAWTRGKAEQWQKIDPCEIFGAVLVGSTAIDSLDPGRYRRGNIGDVIRGLIAKVGPFATIPHIDQEYPYVLHFAVWRIAGSL